MPCVHRAASGQGNIAHVFGKNGSRQIGLSVVIFQSVHQGWRTIRRLHLAALLVTLELFLGANPFQTADTATTNRLSAVLTE